MGFSEDDRIRHKNEKYTTPTVVNPILDKDRGFYETESDRISSNSIDGDAPAKGSSR